MYDQQSRLDRVTTRIDEHQRRYGRQTESLFLAQKTREKRGQETGGSEPWQSKLKLT